MFESLTRSMSKAFSRLTKPGRLTEKNMEEGLAEIRASLLEADVHFKVARDLLARVREKAAGERILESVDAGQMIVKLFHDELVDMMRAEGEPIRFARGRPTILLVAGLQGSGKTTTCAKLAVHLAGEGRRPLLVAADTQRPAAVHQLQVLGESVDVPVFHAPGEAPEAQAARGLEEARRTGRDVVIVDTAGRLHIDDELMAQLQRVRDAVAPDDTFLVCDAMTGQDAVRSASAFQQALPLDGVILTKIDGDTRGGAALSVRHVTGAPVRYVGVGEKIGDLQPFHADRMVSRILGMGDVVGLVEKAQDVVDERQAEDQLKRMMEDRFTLEDFLSQMRMLGKMGSMKSLLGHLPGMPEGFDPEAIDEKDVKRTEAVMLSMTPGERRRPDLLDNSRKRRVARGSGTSLQKVNELLKQFETMRKMMKQMKKGGMMSRLLGRFTPSAGAPDLSSVMSEMAEPAPGRAPVGARAGGSRAEARRRQRKKERQRKKNARKRR